MNARLKKNIGKLLSAVLILAMAFQSFAAPAGFADPAAAEPAKITGTWSTDASGSWHFNAQDGAAKDGWYYLNTTNNATDYNWFCFDANGVMRTGWVQDKNDPSVWYYTGESKGSSEGGLVKGWVTDPQDGKRYYLDPLTGVMCHGWKQIGGLWYYFTESRHSDRKWAPDTTGYWKAGAAGRHSYGSLYVNEWTPDGDYVGANGAWVQNYREEDNSDKPDPIPEYSITVLNDGNGTASASAQKSAAGKEITLTAAPNEGYQFKEWVVESGGVVITENKFTMPAENVAVKAVFEEIPAATYSVTYVANDATSGTVPDAQTKVKGEDLKLAANTGNLAKTGYSFAGWNTASDGTGAHYDEEEIYTKDADLTLYAEWGSQCIAAGTMISMPEGRQKAVEELEIGDVVCTFDHETGEVSSAPVCFIWESKNVSNAFTLTFEDDIEVTVIEEHGFYDQEEQKYVFINLQNAEEYIGDHFYHADTNRWLALKSCEALNDSIDAYAIITSGDLNHMSNGMLSMCDGTVKMIANIFEYDDRMRYDAEKKKADIEAYGLAPIEKILEFDGFIESDYVDYNLQYLNVAVGKGLTTWERIEALSDYFVANGIV